VYGLRNCTSLTLARLLDKLTASNLRYFRYPVWKTKSW